MDQRRAGQRRNPDFNGERKFAGSRRGTPRGNGFQVRRLPRSAGKADRAPEARRIPEWFDYRKVSGLSREVVEKLTRVRPLTLGQAARIPGITPAAVSLMNVYIEIFQRQAAEQAS